MTALEISNKALSAIGESPLADLNGTDKVTNACNDKLPEARKEIIRAFPWSFARARVVLDTPEDDAPAFGFAHAFALPNPCLRVLEVNGISGAGDSSVTWSIEQGLLLCDDKTVNLVYLTDQDDYTLWDDLALQCLITSTAAKMAPLLQGGSTSKANELKLELANMLAPLARRTDGNESRRSGNVMNEILEGSTAIMARFSGA